jgi:hypothetical protein
MTTPSSEYFTTKLSDHRYWIEKGFDLHQGACAVEELVIQWFQAARAAMGLEPPIANKGEIRPGITDVYLLLMGYAAECFLKARLIRKLLRGSKGHRFASPSIPKKVKTHGIKQLCLDIGLSLSSREARVVSLLEEAVVWGGRYPIPVSPAQLKPRTFSESDFDEARKTSSTIQAKKKTKMTQPTKREQLAAMRVEDFKEHLRAIAGGSEEQISGARRPNPLLVRDRKKAARGQKKRRRS